MSVCGEVGVPHSAQDTCHHGGILIITDGLAFVGKWEKYSIGQKHLSALDLEKNTRIA